MTTTETKKPLISFKDFGVETAVWEREHEGKTFYSISVTKSYKDKDGNWQRTSSFTPSELQILLQQSEKALRRIEKLTREPATT